MKYLRAQVKFRNGNTHERMIKLAPDFRSGTLLDSGIEVVYYAQCWWTCSAWADYMLELYEKLDKRLAK